MKIAENIFYNNTNFGTTIRRVYNSTNQNNSIKSYANNTEFFRHDLNWNLLYHFITEKYQNVPKINIYCFACSDGSEPLSLAMLLRAKMKDLANKYFPITAQDFDQEILKNVQNGIAVVVDSDINCINKITKNKFEDFFIVSGKQKFIPQNTCDIYLQNASVYPIRENLKQSVFFQNGDVFKDIKNINLHNSVLFIRNVWPYFSEKQQEELIKSISERCDETSTLILGKFDLENRKAASLKLLLETYGFQPTKLKYCYEKKDNTGINLNA